MSDKLLYLELVTPARTIFSGNIISITVPGELGSFQILYNHAPIISNLIIGEIKVVTENHDVIYYAINNGFIMVLNNRVTIISDSLIKAEEIDIAKTRKELEQVEKDLIAKRKYENVELLESLVSALRNKIRIAQKVR